VDAINKCRLKTGSSTGVKDFDWLVHLMIRVDSLNKYFIVF
jgi:hypothetical protein